MKNLKRLIVNLLIVVLAVAVCIAAGCGGTYVPPGGNGGTGSDKPKPPEGGGSTTGKDRDFTVTLVCDGKPFEELEGVTVYWTDVSGFSQPVSAKFDKDGKARVSGLDGDYLVTLQGLPDKYTYDPNANYAGILNRNIEVEIYRVITIRNVAGQDGSTVDTAKQILAEGAYRLQVARENVTAYYYYKPKYSGTYTVKSLVDIHENLVNPRYRECSGTESGKRYYGDYIDGSGASSTYTVNFDETHDFDSTNIGNILIFGVTAETRGDYPVPIEFLVKRVDDSSFDSEKAPISIPEEFKDVTDENFAAFKAEKDALMKSQGSTFVAFSGYLNGDTVAFNEDDGYYHVVDKNGKPTGPVVCAMISRSPSVFVTPEGEDSFISVEYHGNKALTVDDNYEKYSQNFYPDIESPYDDMDNHFINYKVFIEGYENIASHDVPKDGFDAFPGISEQFAEYKGVKGYYDFVNSDGVYPVTKELQRFLQGYATSQRLFFDGGGLAEGVGLSASERSQWMFACGFYA